MQKKIYSLLFVPCFLALCLALGFLMSCGDTGGGGNEPGKTEPPPVNPPPCANCTNGDLRFNDLRVRVSGDWKLTVEGRIEFYTSDDDPVQISSVLIKMYNQDGGGEKVIMNKTGNLGHNYDLLNGQDPPFDFSPCNSGLNENTQRIYIIVSLSAGSPKDTLLEPFKEPNPACRNDYTLTTSVLPSGAGSVSPASGSFSQNQPVSINANPADGYYFYNWTNSFGEYADSANPYSITMNSEKSFIANFVESRKIIKDQTVDLKVGQAGVRLGAVDNAVSFISSGGDFRFQAGNGVQLIEVFQSRGFKLNDQSRGNKNNEIDDDKIESPSRTHEFIAADSIVTEIEYTASRYFVAKTGSGWGDWFLLLGKTRGSDCRPAGTSPCTELTVWKVQ